MSNHIHTTNETKNFSNTQGAIEICKCQATRLALPTEYGVTRTDWRA